MPWYGYLAHFFAGAFLANGVPHFVQGICGNKFPTPFGRPAGAGESSPLVNVLWGWGNFVVGAILLRAFFPSLPPPPQVSAVTLLGVLAMAAYLSKHFGQVRDRAPRHLNERP